MNETYSLYLRSARWKTLRFKRISESKFKCESCRSTEKLEAHHLTYDRIFREQMDDLMTLCAYCHDKAEGFVKSGLLSRSGCVHDLRAKTLKHLSLANRPRPMHDTIPVQRKNELCTLINKLAAYAPSVPRKR